MTDRELLQLALAMRAAQRDYYENGRTKPQLAKALELERRFDRATGGKPASFAQRFRAAVAELHALDVDDFVDMWHDGQGEPGQSLADFLGMTHDEYKAYAENRGMMGEILGPPQNSPRGEETASADGWEAYNR